MPFVITKPVETHQAEYIYLINDLASQKITSKYPIYKQLNVSRTTDVTTMNTWIDSIRELAQTAKIAIKAAPTIVEIRAAKVAFEIAIETL
jgi:hypothetical protein